MTERASQLAELVEAAEDIVDRLAGGRSLRLVGVGWATVELERAERELGAALEIDRAAREQEAGNVSFAVAHEDRILGAACRVARIPDGPWLLLLEPSTEGRLAAHLARNGEGIAAAYVAAVEGRSSGDGGSRDGSRSRDDLGTDGVGWRDEIGLRGAGAVDLYPDRSHPGPLGLARLLAGSRFGPHVILVESADVVPVPPGPGDHQRSS